MTKNFADLGERGASFKHANGQGVAELMRSRVGSFDLGPLKRVTDDRTDGIGAGQKAADRRHGAKE